MRLTRVRVERYRSIRSLELSVAPLTVIVGANDVGKTNLYRIGLVAPAARGDLAATLAAEGGMPSVLWAGRRRGRGPMRLIIEVELEELVGWRFYHAFRTDPDAPLRQPQPGVRTAVLHHDGRDLAAVLQTIRENGDDLTLARRVSRAFPGSELAVEVDGARFHTTLTMPGVHRPLDARELSDGTLRYLCSSPRCRARPVSGPAPWRGAAERRAGDPGVVSVRSAWQRSRRSVASRSRASRAGRGGAPADPLDRDPPLRRELSLERGSSVGCGRFAEAPTDEASRVIDRFPLGGTSLPELAAQTFGDAHALDKDRELGQLVARAAAHRAGLDDWQSADGRRETWAAVGVLCDELSAPVLTLNLGAAGDGLTDRVLRLHREAGEACSLSLRQLVRHRPALDHLAGRVVFVCENPTVVAVAAERLGDRSAPLVCTSGQPRAAMRVLLRALSAVGARLRVRADMDIDGLHIVKKSLAVPRAAPWRMDRDSYLRAPAGPPLRRKEVPPTPWDPRLEAAMRSRGVAVHEEALLPSLLADLATPVT